MYTPTSFEQADPETLYRFVETYSFGIVISRDPTASMVGSHLPLLLDRDQPPSVRLLGHMARSNPQWQHLDGGQVMVIFSGPHAYISPTWYETDQAVPTWNYLAVHAYGSLNVIDKRERVEALLGRMVDRYEQRPEDRRWTLGRLDAELRDRLLKSIVGFEIVVERFEGKWKLSQNHDQRRRDQVAAALRQQGGENRTAIAELMTDERRATG